MANVFTKEDLTMAYLCLETMRFELLPTLDKISPKVQEYFEIMIDREKDKINRALFHDFMQIIEENDE